MKRTATTCRPAAIGCLAIVACLTLSMPAPTSAETTEDATAALLQGAEALRAKFDLRYVDLRVERRNLSPIEVTVGDSRPGAISPIGSLTKSITAIGIALLIQQGKLRLDSKLGDVLGNYFAQRGRTLDPSLQDVTIERLLAHRAGLRTNAYGGADGITTGSVIAQIGGDSPPIDYLRVQGAGTSDGSHDFVYSNVSYLLLGLVIEAVSGQPYEAFCQTQIMTPLNITDATVPHHWTLVGPYAGWHMSLTDLLRIWSVFDVYHPSLLSPQTLRTTLLGHLGGSPATGNNTFYTLGIYVRQDKPDGPYVANHNGIVDFMRGEPKTYDYAETFLPGLAWAIVVSPRDQAALDADQRRTLANDARRLAKASDQ